MGLIVEPPPEYGDNCNTCFPVDETPVDVYASITGIQTGDFYTGTESPCPNGIFTLSQIAPCEWRTGAFPLVLWRPVIGGSSILTITVADPGLAFTDIKPANCVQRFSNDFDSPVERFHWGGRVQIMTMAGDAPLAIRDIAELVGVPIETDTRADFWPATESDEIIALFARIQDSINILVKQDLTP